VGCKAGLQAYGGRPLSESRSNARSIPYHEPPITASGSGWWHLGCMPAQPSSTLCQRWSTAPYSHVCTAMYRACTVLLLPAGTKASVPSPCAAISLGWYSSHPLACHCQAVLHGLWGSLLMQGQQRPASLMSWWVKRLQAGQGYRHTFVLSQRERGGAIINALMGGRLQANLLCMCWGACTVGCCMK
jgi:hypothetical protein